MNGMQSNRSDARRTRRLGPIGVMLIAALIQVACAAHPAVPSDLDLSTSKPTENGRYHATIQPQLNPIPINRIHSWTLEVRTPDGRPVEQAVITVDGDMPQHGHGLPTRPRVSRNLGKGRFEVEGMKFNMPGWWIVTFQIDGPAGRDRVTFNLML